MNKRNTEGFVLAYVMIVIAVVSAITMALTTSTLNVLKAQEQSVERMQAKYEAMGVIESIIANAENNCIGATKSGLSTEHAAIQYAKDACIRSFIDAFNNHTSSTLTGDVPELTDAQVAEDIDNLFVIESTANLSSDEKIKISATYQFDFDNSNFGIEDYQVEVSTDNGVAEGDGDPQEPEPEDRYKYKIVSVSIDCIAYEITSIGGAA